jgi:peptide/nickel transport system permease protein
MIKLAAGRMLALLPVVFGSSVLVFVILYLIPGDSVMSRLALGTASPERIAELRGQLGLDLPLYEQFARYFSRLLRGDLGSSMITSEPVLDKIAAHFPATLALTAASSAVAATVGIALGMLSAIRRNGATDAVIRLLALLSISMPSFWTGILLILAFSVHWSWLPATGSGGMLALILPAITLGIAGAGFIARMVRNGMLEVLKEPYIAALRAKGLTERTVLYRHALRNALIPAVTLLGMLAGEMMAGAVVIETVFARQGIGRVLADAILAKDIPVVQGVVLFSAVVYVVVNLLVDLSYSLIDPRIRRTQ